MPHRSSAEVLTSLLRGDTQIGVESYAALKAPIDAGQIRAIAASGGTRSPMQPNVPTLKEGGIDAVVEGWNSLVAPAGTPKEIVAVLNGHVRAIVESPDFKQAHDRSRRRAQGQHAGRSSTRGCSPTSTCGPRW